MVNWWLIHGHPSKHVFFFENLELFQKNRWSDLSGQ